MNRREKQNIIIGIVAAAGIILILGAVWVLSREHRFKRYRSDRDGFSIKYPAAWSFEENKDGAAVIFFSPLDNELDFFKESVNVVVQDISGNPLDLKKYSETAIRQIEAVFEENLVILETGPVFFAGQAGYKFIFLGKTPEDEPDLRYMCVWTLKGLKAYQVTYTAILSQYERYLPEMKRMLRSFRIE